MFSISGAILFDPVCLPWGLGCVRSLRFERPPHPPLPGGGRRTEGWACLGPPRHFLVVRPWGGKPVVYSFAPGRSRWCVRCLRWPLSCRRSRSASGGGRSRTHVALGSVHRHRRGSIPPKHHCVLGVWLAAPSGVVRQPCWLLGRVWRSLDRPSELALWGGGASAGRSEARPTVRSRWLVLESRVLRGGWRRCFTQHPRPTNVVGASARTVGHPAGRAPRYLHCTLCGE